jgi:hypothetical protein
MALFEQDGERFVPTELSRGPWDPTKVNGGPVAALVARELERHDGGGAARLDEQLLARTTIDLVRPVPMGPLRVRTSTLKPGRKIQVVEALLIDDSDEVVTRAVAVRMPIVAGFEPDPDAAPLGPDEADVSRPEPGGDVVYYHSHGAEYRVGRLNERDHLMWVRLRTELLPGEPASPSMLAVAASDAPSGLTGIQQVGWRSINADITTQLFRRPEGEWIGMVARSHTWSGIGLAEAELHDVKGRIGRSTETVLVEPYQRTI